MQNIELLLERFLDDRDALAEDELAALVAEVARDPQQAARLKDQLVIDELLAQELAIDRRNFPAQVRQRIRDAESPAAAAALPGEVALVDKQLATDMRQLADLEFAGRRRQTQRTRMLRGLWLATCALLLVAAVSFWWWRQSQVTIAIVQSATGAPSLVVQGQPLAAEVGTAIRQGDRLLTHPGETLVVTFTDRSTLELLGDTSLLVSAGRGTEAKSATLEWGSISADILPQPAGAPMKIATPLALATVRGTRLRLSADSTRTRLDVLEGVVELARNTDRARVDVRSGEFAVATTDDLSVKPLAWPVDRRDAIVILETGDPATPSLVRHARGVELQPIVLSPRGRARMNHDYAWVLQGGAYGVPKAGRAIRNACRTTGELSIEATIAPAHLDQHGPARIITCSQDSHRYNFTLGQEENRLIFRLLTTAADWRSEDIDLCLLSAGQPQHIAVCYRPGELVCFLNGRRVYHDAKSRGNFDNWQTHELLLGNDAAADRNWAGTIEGIAIYDRFLEEDEVAGNAQQYLDVLAMRPTVPQVHLAGTLVARSPLPTPESIAPQRAALVVCRYRVDEVYRGHLPDAEVLVAQWAVLDGQAQPPAAMQIGDKRRMTIERLGLNSQLDGIARIDAFHEGDEPKMARYYEVSDP
jgi:ferric-dicitrate binding protein FerR (iron transport regulator)